MLGEIRHTEKDKYCMISVTGRIKREKKNLKRTGWQFPKARVGDGQNKGHQKVEISSYKINAGELLYSIVT